MFSMFIKAPTMTELREKLIEAANAMGHVGVSVDVPVPQDDHYEPPTEGVTRTQDLPGFEMPTFTPKAVAALPAVPVHVPVTVQPDHVSPTPPATGVDADGYPWDERIHASSKAFNKDGTWRVKRGVEDELLRAVRLATPRGATLATPVPAPMPSMAVPVPQTPVGLPPVAMPTFSPQPAPVAPPAPAPQPVAPPAPVYENIPVPPADVQKPAHTLETFKANIIPTFVTLLNTGKISQHYIEQLKAHFGVKEVWDVKENAAQLQEVFDNFCASGLITRIG